MQEITSQLLQSIKQKIVEAMQPEKIILFGSYAWGAPTDESDVDLFIIVRDTGRPSYQRAREVYRALRGVGVPVDVIVQTHDEAERSKRVPSSLTKKVLEQGVVLYG